MARIAIAGFYHETNTFSPHLTTYEAYVVHDQWPGLSTGTAIFDEFRDSGLNMAIAGALEVLDAGGHDVVPLTWANAVPGSYVTEDAYERILGMIVDGLREAGSLDGVYLDLHGAMVAQHHHDGTGEVLRRVRETVGPDVPIAASLDIHSNTTETMARHADILVGHRTYPHLDMGETGGRAASYLLRMTAEGARPAKALRTLPFLIPLHEQCTLVEPSKGIYDVARSLETGDVWSVSFTPGFPPSDAEHCGPAVFTYGTDRAAVEAAGDSLYEHIASKENAFATRLYDPDEAVRYALGKTGGGKPMVLGDIQDNPGTGGTSDTVGLLEALVRHRAEDAVFGMVYDPEVADQAHVAGLGAEISVSLGAKSGLPGHVPFQDRFVVEALTEGHCLATGPMFGGANFEFGNTALLRIGGVRVLVSHGKIQLADKAMLRHVGIEPAEQKILGVKSTVHFRNDFDDIAEEVLYVTAPGIHYANNADYAYEYLRPGVRLMPMGRPHVGPG